MKNTNRFLQTPYLAQSFLSFLLLGIADTLHHLHAVLALGSSNAMHAVWTGVVLNPISIALVLYFVYCGKKITLWIYLIIAIVTIIVAGFYHGGWDHLVKILAHLRVESESTSIASLFPADNIHLWIYDIVGAMEFFLGLVCAYFTFRLLKSLRYSL